MSQPLPAPALALELPRLRRTSRTTSKNNQWNHGLKRERNSTEESGSEPQTATGSTNSSGILNVISNQWAIRPSESLTKIRISKVRLENGSGIITNSRSRSKLNMQSATALTTSPSNEENRDCNHNLNHNDDAGKQDDEAHGEDASSNYDQQYLTRQLKRMKTEVVGGTKTAKPKRYYVNDTNNTNEPAPRPNQLPRSSDIKVKSSDIKLFKRAQVSSRGHVRKITSQNDTISDSLKGSTIPDKKARSSSSSSSKEFKLCPAKPGSGPPRTEPIPILPPSIELGQYKIQAFYASSYPCDYDNLEHFYICEWCLKYMKTKNYLNFHRSSCREWHPPGHEIYRKNSLSIFQVDGRTAANYCINLCLLSKLFIEDKTVFYDVEPFLFYILVQFNAKNNTGFHLIGYFSKPKLEGEINLSCIMVLPPYQRHGYGRFLIDFSYKLSRMAGTWGTPDRPLSAFGRLSYHSYWKSSVSEFLHKRRKTKTGAGTDYHDPVMHVSINEIREATGIMAEEIVQTLVTLNFLVTNTNASAKNISNNVGNGSACRFALKINWNTVQNYMNRLNSKKRIRIDEEAISLYIDLHEKYKDLNKDLNIANNNSPSSSITSVENMEGQGQSQGQSSSSEYAKIDWGVSQDSLQSANKIRIVIKTVPRQDQVAPVSGQVQAKTSLQFESSDKIPRILLKRFKY